MSGGSTASGGGISTSGSGSGNLGSSGSLGSSSLSGSGLGGSSSIGGSNSLSGSGSGSGSSNSLGGSSSNSSSSSLPALQTGNSSLQKSNAFAGYYGNPYAMGLSTGTSSTSAAAFGSPVYGTTNTNSRSGTGGRVGGGMSGNSSTQSGIVIPIQAQMNYSALLKFPIAANSPSRIQAEIRASIDGTSYLTNPKGVEILTDAANNVTLRGTVADEDEIKLVEGMIRLTPGVGVIKNELRAPAATAGK
jgi:hypothetical protein